MKGRKTFKKKRLLRPAGQSRKPLPRQPLDLAKLPLHPLLSNQYPYGPYKGRR